MHLLEYFVHSFYTLFRLLLMSMKVGYNGMQFKIVSRYIYK
jgi:hypothetical protein